MKKLLIVALLAISVIFTMVACGKKQTDNGGSSEGDTVKVREVTNIDSYTIVRGEKAGDIEKSAATALREAIGKNASVQLSISTDWGAKSSYEILIGETTREISKTSFEALGGDYDYMIKKDGNSIIILGGSPEATLEAVNVFIESFIISGKVYAPSGEGYLMLNDNPVEKLTVDGKDISEYKFYYLKKNSSETAKPNIDFVTEARDRMGEKTGIRLDIVDNMSPNLNYIIVDTTRLNYTKGAIKIENGNITLCGSYHSIDHVMDYFFDTVLGDNREVSLASGTTELDSGDLPTIYSKDDLMKVLEYSYNNNEIIIVGDQIRGLRTAPNYWLDIQKNGGIDASDETLSYAGTGKYPAILGIDLGRCGLRLPFIEEEQWGSISQIVCELVDYAARGGIVTISSHFANPSGYESEWKCDRGNLGSAQGWIDLITEGTPINTEFKKELEMNARVLKALSDAGVPVIWRPMHEMNTPSFWFSIGATGEPLDASCYTNAWKYIYKYFTEEWGITNLIWTYSPNRYNSEKINVMYCYPGDEYVDIVGIDWYTGGKYEIGAEHNPYGTLMDSGKITNLCEVGIGDSLMGDSYDSQKSLYTAEEFMGNFTTMIKDGYKIGYMLTFNYKHTFAYLAGGDEIMASDMVIDLEELPAIFESVAGFKIGA